MPIEVYGLREAIDGLIEDVITVYLHTGDPGSAGTSNRVASGSIGSTTIAATSGWTKHATLGRATAASDLEFGSASAAVTGVSWISMFKGTNFFARRALSASKDVANGADVSIDAADVVINVTSTDS